MMHRIRTTLALAAAWALLSGSPSRAATCCTSPNLATAR